MKLKYCIKCGNELTKDDKLCKKCGTNMYDIELKKIKKKKSES